MGICTEISFSCLTAFFSLIKIVQIKSGFNNNMNINNKVLIRRPPKWLRKHVNSSLKFPVWVLVKETLLQHCVLFRHSKTNLSTKKKEKNILAVNCYLAECQKINVIYLTSSMTRVSVAAARRICATNCTILIISVYVCEHGSYTDSCDVHLK